MSTTFTVMPITQTSVTPTREKTVIWLSRHPMTADQLASLPDTYVLHYNPTFGLDESEAINAMVELARLHNAGRVFGVFPAPLLVEMVGHIRQSPTWGVAIAEPQFAEDGTPRGFAHRGWKTF